MDEPVNSVDMSENNDVFQCIFKADTVFYYLYTVAINEQVINSSVINRYSRVKRHREM
ncbi:hypothetical protein HXA31_19890 [Salipaludibacillus agaradhaerens]|uniref:Uncharacterized protein n=1 Tax=Salipaludibacillus agaradhaerens TaxID=76935 RepID=A0A9Q4B3Q9_SALAG|nr:hypothetical protein [Salipaludibacillus agaradhaerens]MCR6097779.1 hypothetical protein [Salipaludibacillus agaradhaerens]MCR6116592.1 hypothetical protein [Salipaludibacillus agaradhaerens]